MPKSLETHLFTCRQNNNSTLVMVLQGPGKRKSAMKVTCPGYPGPIAGQVAGTAEALLGVIL